MVYYMTSKKQEVGGELGDWSQIKVNLPMQTDLLTYLNADYNQYRLRQIDYYMPYINACLVTGRGVKIF